MISVCMATYNGAVYLREQVDSIVIQLGDNDELIVSDDGSTDDTIDILKSYNDSRIKVFINRGKKGVVANFENALKHAVGEYIFLSDQDDVWFSDKVEKCIKVLESADLVVTDCVITDSHLHPIEPSFFSIYKSRAGFWKNLWRNTYLGACVAFRKDILKIALPIPSNLPVYHEGWLASLADITGKVVFYDEPLIYFRRHGDNTSSTAGRSGQSLFRKVYNRILLMLLVYGRLLKVLFIKK